MTVALFFVARTTARHDGQVTGLLLLEEAPEARAELSWKANHSLRHAPQKVWRQSRRVRGWYRTSVQICSASLLAIIQDESVARRRHRSRMLVSIATTLSSASSLRSRLSCQGWGAAVAAVTFACHETEGWWLPHRTCQLPLQIQSLICGLHSYGVAMLPRCPRSGSNFVKVRANTRCSRCS